MPSFVRSRPLLVSLLAIACHGDATAPRPTLSIAIRGGATWSVDNTSPDVLSMHCSATFTAVAQGPGVATWQDGVARFYLGASRTVPVDSQVFTIADMRSAWGATITQNDRPQTVWTFTGSVPFEVEIEVRYATEGSAEIVPAKTRVGCGPGAAAGTYAVPVVTALDVSPMTGEVQPGGGLDVTYTATSSYPLWSTTVTMSGPFLVRRVFAERGATTVTRTVHMDIPSGALKDAPINVTVMAEDGALQQSGRSVQTQDVVVDRTPPVISFAVSSPTRTLAGQYAVGDTLRFTVVAHDNDQLDWLVWALGSPANARDSLPAPTRVGEQTWEPALPVKPEWVGAPILSLYARDAAGFRSTVVSSGQDSIRFYPVVAHPTSAPATVTSTATAALELSDVAYDAKRNVFYIALGPNTNEVAVLDVATMTFATPLVLPSPTTGLDLTVSGDSLVAALPATRSLAVVNLAQPGTSPTTIRLSVLDTVGDVVPLNPAPPMLVRLAANGMAVITLPFRTWSGDGIITVDLRTGTQAIRTDARNGGANGVFNAGSTPDRSRVPMYQFPCPRSYLAATDSFTACGPGVEFVGTRGITFDAAGQRMSLGNGAYDVDFHNLRSSWGINGTIPISAISADGTLVYFGANQTVSAMRIADGVFTERINIPVSAQRLFVSPAGDWLMAFQSDGGVRAARVNLR